MCKFSQHNLLKDKYPDRCDLIVCRNVMIYFTEEAKQVMYQKFNDALKKDGILLWEVPNRSFLRLHTASQPINRSSIKKE